MIELRYKAEIAKVLKCDEASIFLYWKGRIALYAFLKSLNLNAGDEVIVPAFTCVVVPNAIIYAGLKPVYVDISSKTYNIDISLVEKAITNRTKVVLVQNTFGLSSNIEVLCLIAKKYNLITIEDCTHGFGGFYNGKPNGSFCDAAFYSTQWNKPFSTGIGGFLVVNKKELLTGVKYLNKFKINPSFVERSILLSLLLFKNYLINNYTYWFMVKLFRSLSNKNLVVGSNQGKELNSTVLPKNYFKGISSFQIRTGIKSIKSINDLNLLRKKNAKDYTLFLKSNNKIFVEESEFNNHLFLKYPLIVKDRQKFFEKAKKYNIILGDWFLSPLHPVQTDLSPWYFYRAHFPVADAISSQIVNLPTDLFDNSQVLNFLFANIDLIK